MAFVPQEAVTKPQGTEASLKIMMFPLGFLLAHVGRLVMIGQELRERGHEVIFAGDWPDHHRSRLDIAAKAGFDVVHMKEPDHPYAWDRFQKWGWPVTGYDLARLKKWSPIEDILDDHVRIIHEHQPDMMVCDASITTSTTSHITGVPAAGVLNAYGVSLISPGSFFHPIVRAWDKLMLARMRKPVYDKYGVKPRDAMDLLRTMPLLSPDLEGLYEPPGDYWPNYHTVGPIISEPSIELPEWYGELDDGTPNIYITKGSTGFLDAFLRETYEAFGKMPYRFVVTTAGQASRETVDMAPGNFRITRYAPGSKILDKCQAMIFHGGNGSMYQALAAGVPMIACPSHLEQEICADLAVRHGFGLKIPARKVSPAKLHEMVQRVLNDPSFRQTAERFGGRVRHANGAARAADVIERIARDNAAQKRAPATG